MLHGEVVRRFSDRRFGFIRSALEPNDVFFHQRAMEGDFIPVRGMQVSFTVELDARTGRKRAGRVSKLESEIPLPISVFR